MLFSPNQGLNRIKAFFWSLNDSVHSELNTPSNCYSCSKRLCNVHEGVGQTVRKDDSCDITLPILMKFIYLLLKPTLDSSLNLIIIDNTVLYYPFIEWPAGQVRVCFHKRKTRYIVHFPLQQLQHKKTAIKTGIQSQQFCWKSKKWGGWLGVIPG